MLCTRYTTRVTINIKHVLPAQFLNTHDEMDLLGRAHIKRLFALINLAFFCKKLVYTESHRSSQNKKSEGLNVSRDGARPTVR